MTVVMMIEDDHDDDDEDHGHHDGTSPVVVASIVHQVVIDTDLSQSDHNHIMIEYNNWPSPDYSGSKLARTIL